MRRKRSQIEGSVSEQRLHHLAQGVYPDDAEAKKTQQSRFTPQQEEKDGRLRKKDESAQVA